MQGDQGRVTLSITVPASQLGQLDKVLATVKKSFQDATYDVHVNMTNVGKVAVLGGDVDKKDIPGDDDSSLVGRKALRTFSSKLAALGGTLTQEIKASEQRMTAVVQATHEQAMATWQKVRRVKKAAVPTTKHAPLES